jgi:hypothetical protein
MFYVPCFLVHRTDAHRSFKYQLSCRAYKPAHRCIAQHATRTLCSTFDPSKCCAICGTRDAATYADSGAYMLCYRRTADWEGERCGGCPTLAALHEYFGTEPWKCTETRRLRESDSLGISWMPDVGIYPFCLVLAAIHLHIFCCVHYS